MLEWTYSGVNLSIKGTGGTQCIKYLPSTQIITETIIISILALLYCFWSWSRLRLPYRARYATSDDNIRRLFLFLHGVTFGVELGFKFATNSSIWVLNPCHMITVLQLVILTMPYSPLTTALFRLNVHMVNGPIIALIFPVVNTRLLQFEQFVYYVQHTLILVVPIYLIKSEGVFSVEPLLDMSYAVMSLGLQTLYHFWVLQYVSYITLINLDNIFCPAISDPFHGIHYRKWAVLHQSALILIHGKIITFLSFLMFQSFSLPQSNDCLNSKFSIIKNGHIQKPTKFKSLIALCVQNRRHACNHSELCIKDQSIWDLFLDQRQTIEIRSFILSRSNSPSDNNSKKSS